MSRAECPSTFIRRALPMWLPSLTFLGRPNLVPFARDAACYPAWVSTTCRGAEAARSLRPSAREQAHLLGHCLNRVAYPHLGHGALRWWWMWPPALTPITSPRPLQVVEAVAAGAPVVGVAVVLTVPLDAAGVGGCGPEPELGCHFSQFAMSSSATSIPWSVPWPAGWMSVGEPQPRPVGPLPGGVQRVLLGLDLGDVLPADTAPLLDNAALALVECGNMKNPDEAAQTESPDGRARYARRSPRGSSPVSTSKTGQLAETWGREAPDVFARALAGSSSTGIG